MPSSSPHLTKPRRILVMMALMAAGEVVFLLPFVLARVFRPTLLDVLEVSHTELGLAFSVYGLVAMAAYLLGGPLADRFSARGLMTAALAATGLGGVGLAATPSPAEMNLLWGGWGITTILLFWSALLRATREWGGTEAQGRAFGLLDGGRGLVAALIASATVAVFSALLPDDPSAATLAEKATAFEGVVWVCTGFTLAVAALVWLVVPGQPQALVERPRLSARGVLEAARRPTVWLQAVIVVCAYVGYKSTDDFSMLARDGLGYDDVEAGAVGTLSFWVRAVTAVVAGYVADRIDASRVVCIGFVLLGGGSGLIASGVMGPSLPVGLLLSMVATSVGVYALRSVYFALLAEGGVPLSISGSAIGLVSFIGFTPDVFMGPLMGVFLDGSPGMRGHRLVFASVAAFALVGAAATMLFRRWREAPPSA